MPKKKTSGPVSSDPASPHDPRIEELIRRLRRLYPNAKTALRHSNPLELLIATILSAQCTDEMVNKVTAELFKKRRTAADYAEAPIEELEKDIHSLGFFRNKARAIKACCKTLVEKHGGQVPDSMEELVKLDGVGRKTANVVLGNAFGRNEGVVVDTHVARLARRLGLTEQTNPEKIEQDLAAKIPRDLWTEFSHCLIWHGRRRCSARRPQCEACELRDLCPSADTAVKEAAAPKRKRSARRANKS